MNNESNGITIQGLMAVVFITLKLTGIVTWSWWWVLSPLWISFLIYMVVIAIALIVAKIVRGDKDGKT